MSNAVVLLSLSTAASLFWLWRPFTSRRPIVRVAHLSDLHIVGDGYGYRMANRTDGPSGDACVRQALEKLNAMHASTPLDRVLVTGNVTDAGTRAEWIELSIFFVSVPRSGLASSLCLATTT